MESNRANYALINDTNNNVLIIKEVEGNKHIITINGKKCNTDNLKKQYINSAEKTDLKNEINKQPETVLKNINSIYDGKINGSFNNVEYTIKEGTTSLFASKKYTGVINGKETEYIVNPEQGKFHKGKIQGNIGDDNVNLIVTSDIFGKRTIAGLYKNERVELTVLKDLFCTHIEGKGTNVNIKRNFFKLDKSLEGKFGYNDELMPLILSYIKYSEDVRKESALSA